MNAPAPPRRVLVTGGTGSVGRAIVAQFSGHGHTVTFQYHSNHDQAAILQREYGALPLALDLATNTPLPSQAYDILINCAGINITSALSHQVSLEDWQRTLAVNLTASFMMVQACLPTMIEQRWGRIINISSIYGLRGRAYNLPYNVSKHGVTALTRTLALEYASDGITTNAICPGPIDSDLLTAIAHHRAQQGSISADDFIASVKRNIPDGSFAAPSRIAALAAFLASDAASHINGTSIPVDGGQLA